MRGKENAKRGERKMEGRKVRSMEWRVVFLARREHVMEGGERRRGKEEVEDNEEGRNGGRNEGKMRRV